MLLPGDAIVPQFTSKINHQYSLITQKVHSVHLNQPLVFSNNSIVHSVPLDQPLVFSIVHLSFGQTIYASLVPAAVLSKGGQ